MLRIYLVGVCAGLLVSSIGCSKDTSAADLQAVKDQEVAWSKDCGTKDAAKCTSYYSADATFMMPNEPILHGRDSAKAAFAPLMADPNFMLSFQGDKAEVSGNMAYTQGTYSLSLTDPKGNKVSDKGKYLTVWKKQADGTWQAAEDIFNSDLPAGGN